MLGKSYYLQSLTVHNQELKLVSDWFRSDGISYVIEKKPEVMFKVAGRLRRVLSVIENEAKIQLEIPHGLLLFYGFSKLIE